MSGATKVDGAATLRRRWRRWLRAVALYSGRGWAVGSADPAAYGELHGQLLAACERLAETGGPAERQFYEALTELVRPWVSPAVFARTERDLLADLWERCRAADRRLRGQRPALRVLRAGAPFLWLLAGLTLLGAFAFGLDFGPALFGGYVRALAEGIGHAFFRLTEMERFVLLMLILGILGITLFADTAAMNRAWSVSDGF